MKAIIKHFDIRILLGEVFFKIYTYYLPYLVLVDSVHFCFSAKRFFFQVRLTFGICKSEH